MDSFILSLAMLILLGLLFLEQEALHKKNVLKLIDRANRFEAYAEVLERHVDESVEFITSDRIDQKTIDYKVLILGGIDTAITNSNFIVDDCAILVKPDSTNRLIINNCSFSGPVSAVAA